jgi:hypothetical protein
MWDTLASTHTRTCFAEGQSTLSGPEAVRSGSEITLKCVVELDDATLAANTPYNIQWLLNDTALKTNDDRSKCGSTHTCTRA